VQAPSGLMPLKWSHNVSPRERSGCAREMTEYVATYSVLVQPSRGKGRGNEVFIFAIIAKMN
jgi:hypothetical protein